MECYRIASAARYRAVDSLAGDEHTPARGMAPSRSVHLISFLFLPPDADRFLQRQCSHIGASVFEPDCRVQYTDSAIMIYVF